MHRPEKSDILNPESISNFLGKGENGMEHLYQAVNAKGVLPGHSSVTELPFSYFGAVPYRLSGTLRLSCSNTSTMLTPSRMCPMPAMPEIAALVPLENSVPSTCATPRTTIITAVMFRPT